MAKSKSKKQSIPILKIIGGVIALLVLAYLIYAVNVYQESEAEESGIVACAIDGKTCTISGHWHATIHVELCGEKVVFPLETGDLGQQHTHKERDLMHWHATLPYDQKAETIKDFSPLRLGNFFENLKMPLSSNCLGKFCNGQTCPDGKTHHLEMLVNGQSNQVFADYVWKDGDEIIIKTIPG